MKKRLLALLACLAASGVLASGAAADASRCSAPIPKNVSQESFLPGGPESCEDASFSLAQALDDLNAACASVKPETIDLSAEASLGLDLPKAQGCIETVSIEEGSTLPEVPVVVNKNVESYMNYFQNRGRKYFEKWWDRSQNYMTMLRSILKENGLPEDLSYIAFIESGINPTAKSHANAVGMWQFIKGTALRYGLRVDWWVDERMDPEKATYAAAKYFKNLYDQFGHWYLAAAGYNAGEGKVARAMKKHNTDDFWELASKKRPFRRETKDYVPKYLAALTIGKDPTSYGFDEIEYLDSPPYEKVRVEQATDLKVVAQAAGTSVEEIRRLNPELLRQFTPPNYPGYEIKVPIGAAGRFSENIERLSPVQRISFQMHKVKRGETIAKIAKKYGASTDAIMYVNNISKQRVKPGTVLAIPVKAAKGKEMALAYSDIS